MAIALLALLVVGGGCRTRSATLPAPDRVAEDARVQPLRVGTSGDYAPFSARAGDGTLAGFDVEVARAYGDARRRPVTFVPFHWPELAARFAAGDFDVVMSGVTVRADRLVAGLMTAAVARADAVLVVAARAPGGLRTLDRAGRTVAVNRGGHLEQVARTRLARARIVAVDDNQSLPELLSAGRADAIVTDSLELAAFQARCSPAPCLRVAARLARDRKAYWVPRAQSALAADLDGWLLERERVGWLPALRARHLGAAPLGALDPATARLADRVVRRLSLMPAVAAAKRALGRPIEDRGREADVERMARAHAAAAGLDADRYGAFVRAEIAAAKAVQIAAPADTAVAATLADLRRAIDELDAAIIDDFATLVPIAASRGDLTAALEDTELPGLSRDVAGALAAAMLRVARRLDDRSTGRALPFGGMVGGGSHRSLRVQRMHSMGGGGCEATRSSSFSRRSSAPPT